MVTRGCGNNAVLLAAVGREARGGVGEAYSVGVGMGRGAEDMSPGEHCENVTATLTAGQFSKSDTAGHFPLCVGTMNQGGRAGGGGGDSAPQPEGCFH